MVDTDPAGITGTALAAERSAGMGEKAIWLVSNDSSGSNDDKALAALEQCCGSNGFRVAQRTVFPKHDLPTPAMLDAAGIDRVVVFAGDGTVNSLIKGLAGWSGAVLVLAGGTMNLLYHRLHGQRSVEETIAAVARGETMMRRPGVIRAPQGDAFAGLLAGPGASWGRVREAMRDANLAELAQTTVTAINETLTGEQIACLEPQLGAREGYPLLSLTPHDDGIEIEAYHAQNAGEYLEQTWALLKRDFREGPHDVLGKARALTLGSTEGNPFAVLIDGEQAQSGATLELRLAECEVDLLATETG